MSVLHVGCAIEGDYVPHSAAMLHSVLHQSGSRGVHVHYMHGPDLPAAWRAPLTEMVQRHGGEISFVCVPDERCEGFPSEGFTGKATWYRILVAEMLPDVERILFLDADVLALDSLEKLWGTDVSDHYLAAVTNVFQADHLFRAAELGLDPPDKYFNAGVLLLNLDLIRCDRRIDVMRDFALSARELMFRDQDALNFALAGRRLALDPRWNAMNAFEAFPWSAYVFGSNGVAEAMATPGIRHFEGPSANKPWHRACRARHRELYFEHRRGTPWPDVEMEGEAEHAPSGMERLARGVVRRFGRKRSAREDAPPRSA